MAQTGYTPILIYASGTPTNVPLAANLTSSASGAELALNYADGKLYFKNSSGVVTLLAGSGGGGPAAGSNTQVQFNNNGVFGASANMTFNGTRLTVADLADSGLTATRVVYSTTGGALTDSANLTFDGTNLTLGGGVANGVTYLNGSKVLTTGSALTFTGANLGVGIATAAQRVHIYESAAATGAFLQVQEVGGQNAYFGVNTSGGSIQVAGANPLQFAINGSEQMRLTSTGLGIGTSSPAYKLDVAGTVNVVNGSNGRINIGATNNYLYGDSSGNFIVGTSGSDKLQLTSSGNLGLGVTPSASTRGKGFDIGLTGGLYGDGITVNFSTHLTNNAYPLANGNWVYKNSSQVAQRYSMESSGQHQWFTAPSGTAGNAISFTQAMTLTASSELNIDSGAGGGRLTFQPGSGANSILSTTTGFGAYNILRYYGTQHQWFNPSSQAMTLDASGKLLVGTTTAEDFRLAVRGSGMGGILATAPSGYNGIAHLFGINGVSNGYQINCTSGNAISHVWSIGGGAEAARIDSSGNLLVGTTSNPNNSRILGVGVGDNVAGEFYRPGTGVSSAIVTFLSNVGGTRTLKSYIDTAGALISTSDARLKENVKAFDAGIDCVLGLNPVYFSWKGDASTQAGFIAQEVEQVLPIAVREMQSNGLEDMRTLDKNVLFPVLVKAIQEQQAIINQLKARLDAANL